MSRANRWKRTQRPAYYDVADAVCRDIGEKVTYVYQTFEKEKNDC